MLSAVMLNAVVINVVAPHLQFITIYAGKQIAAFIPSYLSYLLKGHVQ